MKYIEIKSKLMDINNEYDLFGDLPESQSEVKELLTISNQLLRIVEVFKKNNEKYRETIATVVHLIDNELKTEENKAH